MKLKWKITFLANRDYTTIEIEDDDANVNFVKVKLTPEQLSMILWRQACVDCELEVMWLEKVWKKHENKSFEFEIPESLRSSRRTKELNNIANSQLKDWWISNDSYSSQGSFFSKDGKYYARATIRRWI